jgi:basic membrane protein A
MSTKGTRYIAFAVVVLTILLGACGATEAPVEPTAIPEPTEIPPEPVKVALLLYGPLADTGWNATAYEGLLDAEKEFGIEIALAEDVPVPEMEAVMRDYASQGYDLIIGHSFPFGEPAMAVAPEFPDTFFVTTNGYVEAANVVTFNPKEVEANYLAGILAAKLTQTGKVGEVAGVELPNMIANDNALLLGAQSVNPDIQFTFSYVGSWGDPAKGKELTLALIQDGVDVIIEAGAASGLGTLEACAESDITVISYISRESDAAPEEMVAELLPNYRAMIKYEIELFLKGELEGKIYRPDLKSGLLDLFMTDAVPADARAAVEAAKAAIISGEIEVPEIFE